MKALICPACGGALDPPAADAVNARCPYCGMAVQLGRFPALIRRVAPPSWPNATRVWTAVAALVPLVALTAYLRNSSETRSGSNGVLSTAQRFGEEGLGAGQFTELREFAAGNGLIFTQERKGRVQAFDLTGRQVGAWVLPGEFSYRGFGAGSDGSVYKPYGRVLHRFEGKSGKPLGELDAGACGLEFWQFLAPGPSGTLFAADSRTAIQIDAGTGQVLMRSPYRKPFKSVGGFVHFTANPLGEVYFADVSEHDIVRISPDGELKSRFVTTKLKGLTPLAMALATLPVSARLGVATALGLELYDPDGRLLDMIRISPLEYLAAPDEKHLAGWINYSSQVQVFAVK